MKDYAWKIKVADLLNNPGENDNIIFSNKFLKNKEIILSNKGLNGEIFLQGLNHDEILLKIKKISFSINYQCDICLEDYIKEYSLKDLEEVRFVNTKNIELNEEIHDTTFPIDMKNQIIDISELIEIIVKNEEPFIKKCNKCKNKNKTSIEKNQEKNSYYKFDFGKMLKS